MAYPVFFTSIADVRVFVKINASLPWDSFSPYVVSADDMFLRRYFSARLIEEHSDDVTFMLLCRKVLAPVSVALSADEMSISIGDSGITVQNDKEKRSPASDEKIYAAKRSLFERGHASLSMLIKYVLDNRWDISDCPRLVAITGLAVPSLDDFEKYVGIGSDYVTFFELVPLLRTIQERLAARIGEEFMTSAFQADEGLLVKVAGKCRAWICYQCAYLQTSQTTREQRGRPRRSEWDAVLRPVFSDLTATGSWYGEIAEDTLAEIVRLKSEIEAEVGSVGGDIDTGYNGNGRKFFKF